MKLGAEPKKIAMLGGLLLICGYFFYTNVVSDPNDTPARQAGNGAAHNTAVNAALNSAPAVGAPAARGSVVRGSSSKKSSGEFRPTMKRKPDEVFDPMAIDPTLRLDLLAKVQSVELDSAGRNPFQFGAAPAPPVPVVKVDPKELLRAKNAPPKAAEPPKPAAPTGPPPLNLPWKYYGYTSAGNNATKKAFFLDGEEILSANEGDMVKRKYKVVRIGVNSVVVEDTETKSQQTMPLAEEAVG